MPISGFGFDKIIAEKKKDLIKDLKVDPKLTITKLEWLEPTDARPKSLRFRFHFEAAYNPNIALIGLDGSIIYSDSKDKLDEIYKLYEKDKSFDDSILNPILGIIQINSNIKALELSREIGVPPHLGMPVLQVSTGKSQGNQGSSESNNNSSSGKESSNEPYSKAKEENLVEWFFI